MKSLRPALVIIDMQRCMRGEAAGNRNNPEAERNIATLLAAWRAASASVVHVRHISRIAGSLFWPGQPGVEFQTEFLPSEGEHVVEKHVPDAFTNSGLDRWLHSRGIQRVACRSGFAPNGDGPVIFTLDPNRPYAR